MNSACAVSTTRSKFLACCFAIESADSSARSAFSSTPNSGLPRFRLLPRFSPLCRSQRIPQTALSGFHYPSGLLPPSGSTLPPVSLSANPPSRTCPISVRSPQPSFVARFGCGSSFPVRYCPVGLLFLKPLGTSFTMRPHPSRRQRIYAEKYTFSSVFISFVTKRLRG
jgi:hypothetical protein